MELSSKTVKQIAFNTRPKIEEHMLIVMNESVHEENLSQPLQTNNNQFKIAITFLTGYNGIFNITDKNNQFFFQSPLNHFDEISISPGAYEIESLDLEIKRLIINRYAGMDDESYPFSIKPNFSTLGSIIEIKDEWKIDFTQDNTIRDVLGFKSKIVSEEYNLSDNPVDIISFDNIFIECDIAKAMIFKSKRTGIIHNFTMDVNPGYRYTEKFRGGVQWYMMENKDFVSNIGFKLKNENGNLVSFNGQSVTFRLSIKDL